MRKVRNRPTDLRGGVRVKGRRLGKAAEARTLVTLMLFSGRDKKNLAASKILLLVQVRA